jgi:hypothetical protein
VPITRPLCWAAAFSSVGHVASCLRDASAMSQRCLSDASAMPQGCLRDASGMSQRCLSDASAMPQRCLSDVTPMSQRCAARREGLAALHGGRRTAALRNPHSRSSSPRARRLGAMSWRRGLCAFTVSTPGLLRSKLNPR